MQVLGPPEFKMKRGAPASDEPLKKRKTAREDSSDEDEESSQRTTSQDSSQSESHSDVEDHKPSFSRPSDSQNAEGSDASSNFSMYNTVSQKLMAKMGFREGEGLGKYGQGRKEIVEASTQRGRRGLGLTLKGFQGDLNVDWQDEPEPTAIEQVSWFPEGSPEIPDSDELKDWIAVGQKKLKIDDETEFCSGNLLHLLLRCKSVFDDLEGEEMRRARTRSNPYETIRGAFFLNRAAMKMANMDHVFDYMFTNPKDSQGKPQTRDKEGELLYFGDVCAGPGGFSEYVLWRRRWHAKGFGMTLKGANDFKLEDFYAAPSELFEAYYGTDAVREYMFTINLKLNQFRHSDRDVTEVVPLEIIKGDTDFFQFMINSNESHCAVQIKALAKIHAYVRDTTLFESRQADIRKECLKLWGIPDKARVTPPSSDPKTKFYELMKGSEMDSFNSRPTALNSGNLDKLQHVLDYRCIVGGGEQLFLLGLGRSQIYTWDGKAPLRWKKLENFKLELPRETLLSVEIVQELKGEGKAQRRINAVHILDALVLNGTDVRDQHFNQRIQMAEKFVKAVSKPSRPDMNPIRVKEVYRLEEMEKIFVRLEMKVTKSSGGMPRLSYTGRDDRHFLPNGLYIIKTVNDPWTMAFSKNSKRKFFYNKQTKESTYALPPGSVAPFHACHKDRLFWAWEEGVRVHDSQTRVNPDKLSKDDVLSFIHQHCQQ
ncbi:Cap-specific mRNA (nucleoside-2'-O-)-methyltransferase 1 [Anabarilius grahami]|uniref:Cap-specific mRNA (nucleoside-2'-O-)-methyltransferase 1 n=1 Tax=Anabarilius grahami TaxID=495550 RepID=A0A3N0YA78_ANAGA|nr:Cap-specific mRNA (nucleoside-2'-O-)-methyltransferase 1 [Anabarilius grahami]